MGKGIGDMSPLPATRNVCIISVTLPSKLAAGCKGALPLAHRVGKDTRVVASSLHLLRELVVPLQGVFVRRG